MAVDMSSEAGVRVTMSFRYSYLDDPDDDVLTGNMTWIVPDEHHHPAHWEHAEQPCNYIPPMSFCPAYIFIFMLFLYYVSLYKYFHFLQTKVCTTPTCWTRTTTSGCFCCTALKRSWRRATCRPSLCLEARSRSSRRSFPISGTNWPGTRCRWSMCSLCVRTTAIKLVLGWAKFSVNRSEQKNWSHERKCKLNGSIVQNPVNWQLILLFWEALLNANFVIGSGCFMHLQL